MNDVLLGAIAMATFVAGLYFLRFWKSTGDRLFLFFAISFWLESTVRIILAVTHAMQENVPHIYLMRLLGFGLILFAVIQKNLPKKTSKH